MVLVAHDVRKKRKRKRMTYTVQLEPQPQGRAGFKLLAKLSASLFHAAQPRHLKAGERLFAVGDAGDGCYLLDQGLLKVTVTSPRGEERIIAILGPGAIVGELSMIDGMPRSASVAALRDSVFRFVGRESFKQCANANPETHQVLLTIVAARLRQVDEALAATTFLTVKARVARALIELAEHVGQSSEGHIVFSEKISQGDLAAMAGVARENVSRVLSDWRRRKFVTGSPSRYCLINVAALKREMNGVRVDRRAPSQDRSGMGRMRFGGREIGADDRALGNRAEVGNRAAGT
jgi:CRP/FNR family transcriptional regulator, cyclic AMP receptor protein